MLGAANLNSSLLTLSVIAVLIPAAFIMSINSGQNTLTTAQEGDAVLKMSRGVSIHTLYQVRQQLMIITGCHNSVNQ